MSGAHQPSPDPYRDEILRRVGARAPLGFQIFLGCLALSVFFEMLRFPERRRLMAAFAVLFVALVGLAWSLVRRRPAWTVPVLLGFVNAVAVGVNAYHVIAHGSVAMCIWQLTGILGVSAVLFPWGVQCQLLAAIGALLSYPLHLQAGAFDPLTWAAGATYLTIVVSLSVFGAALFTRHVRDSLRLTAALSEREARLQSYFDLALVGTAILSPNGGFAEVNDELSRMLGYGSGELLRSAWTAVVHPDDRPTAAGLVARTLDAGGVPERTELRCVRRDGQVIQTIISVRGLPGSRGAIDHVMVLVQDVTERKRAEAEREEYLVHAEAARREAEQASSAKDAFLATVSHELRTPLTPILAWSNLLRGGNVGGDRSTAALAAIERNARAQAQLIDDLLDVSRIVSGEWRLTLRPVALASVIRAAVDVVQPGADAKGVTIEAVVPAQPVSVRGDADRLQQVVANLLSNAVKFTPPRGRVQVRLEHDGERVRLAVHDSGEGIRPEFLPHVFERFRQADSSSTRRHGGLGLGLAIVRTLVERHGGTVRAESPGEGQGAAFTVELPLLGEAAAGAGAEPAGEPVSRPALHGLRVLVVDDDADSNAVVSALLTACGAEVRTVASAAEALEVAGRWRPDVLVSDIAMPGDDGCVLLRELRARGGGLATVPAIALTAHADAAERGRTLAAGFREHIAKPFDPAQLAVAVGKAAVAPPLPPAA